MALRPAELTVFTPIGELLYQSLHESIKELVSTYKAADKVQTLRIACLRPPHPPCLTRPLTLLYSQKDLAELEAQTRQMDTYIEQLNAELQVPRRGREE